MSSTYVGFTLAFESGDGARKFASYWTKGRADKSGMRDRGWPDRDEWLNASCTPKGLQVRAGGEVSSSTDVEELVDGLRRCVVLAIVDAFYSQVGEQQMWFAVDGKSATAERAVARAIALGYEPKLLLALALSGGDAKAATAALKHGADANAKIDGVPAVLLASRPELVHALLEAGANARGRDRGGELLSRWTAHLGLDSFRVVAALLEAGVDPNAGEPPPLLAIARRLVSANAKDRAVELRKVEALLAKGADPHRRERDGADLFSYAKSSKPLQAVLKRLGVLGKGPVQARRAGPLDEQLKRALLAADAKEVRAIVGDLMQRPASECEKARRVCREVLVDLHALKRAQSALDLGEECIRALGARRREWKPATPPVQAFWFGASTDYERATRSDVCIRACFAETSDAQRFAGYCMGDRDARSAYLAQGWPDPDAWSDDITKVEGRAVWVLAKSVPKTDVDALLAGTKKSAVVMIAAAYKATGFMLGVLAPMQRLALMHYAVAGKRVTFAKAFARVLELEPSLALSSALEHKDLATAELAMARGASALAPVEHDIAVFHPHATPELVLQFIARGLDPNLANRQHGPLLVRWQNSPKVVEALRRAGASPVRKPRR